MLVTPSTVEPGVTAVEPGRPRWLYRDEIGKNRVDGCLEDSHHGVNMADPGVNTADPDVNTVPIRNTADPGLNRVEPGTPRCQDGRPQVVPTRQTPASPRRQHGRPR